MVLGEFPSNSTFKKNEERVPGYVREATSYIRNRLSPFLTIKEIASVVRKHPSDLDRMFARVNGMTIKQYIDRLCRKEVENRLRRGITKGSQIAFDLGFRDDQAFYRWIRRVFGIPFRQLQQLAFLTEPMQDLKIRRSRKRMQSELV